MTPNISRALYLITGLYVDGHDRHTTNSVELYLPWNDSWIDLPDLPDFAHDGAVVPMTDTHIMSLAISGDANHLHLVGGQHSDWSTSVERMTGQVWRLEFDQDKHRYYWDGRLDRDMGRFGLLCSHFSYHIIR